MGREINITDIERYKSYAKTENINLAASSYQILRLIMTRFFKVGGKYANPEWSNIFYREPEQRQ